ncbi:MAG: EAL domain-containing protein [Pseudomonadota bacterium]
MEFLRDTVGSTPATPEPMVNVLTSVGNLWIVTATIMVLSMQAGFLMLEAGSTRSKNTINVAQKNIADFIICGCVFILIGVPLMFGAGQTGWFGFGGFDISETKIQLMILFQFAFCATAATIISGAVSERMRFRAYMLLTVLISGIVYPVFGHLVWGNAIIGSNPASLSDIGFLDFAGSTVVHVIGGSAALAAVLHIGPRKDLYDANGKLQTLRGHSSVLTNYGTMVLMFGWLGFNAGGAHPHSDNFSQILLNTVVAMTFGGATGLAISVLRGKGQTRPKTSTSAILGGLVAITAGCAYVDHYGAALIGMIGGLTAVFTASILLNRFGIDDPVDAIAVHGAAGIVGTVMVAPLAHEAFITGSRVEQFAIQLGGTGLAAIWAFATVLVFLWFLKRFVKLRVSAYEEEIGLNLSEHDDSFDTSTISELVGTDLSSASNTSEGSGLLSEHVGDGARDPNSQLNMLSKVVEGARLSKIRVEEAETTINRLSTQDHLTGLHNRTAFRQHLAESAAVELALIYLDLDGFKAINDGFGHSVGDEVLKQIAARLVALLPSDATVARFGGDEFVISLPLKAKAPAGEQQDWQINCSQIVQGASQVLRIGNLELFVGASLGVSLFPHHSGDLDGLILKADMALYEAKARGKGQWVVFNQDMEMKAQRRAELESDMRAGIDRGEFYAVFQPQVLLKESRLIGFEALMRWDHPVHGTIVPSEFIPIAEETGLIVEMSETFIQYACAVAVNWPLVKGQRCKLSVNLSPIQFSRSDVPAMLERVLESTGMDAGSLEIEVTESTLIDDVEETREKLEAIRAMGVKVAIDDFGTGYSSFNYLQGFPLDRLKIDRSFISELEDQESAQRITKAIVELGRSLGLTTIAEGVETEGQRRILEEFGCDEFQGYLSARPMSLAKTLTWIVNTERQKTAEDDLKASNG